jgi:NRAMP (natural resistance-associated macrophage protein)-like metal ion transporter
LRCGYGGGGVSFWRRWRTSLILFFAVLGPGFITANVDNDAGGIFTYSQAGAQYGYKLLWTMIPITIALIVVQEMCARMGVVTGKGLSDLIREEFGLRMTFFVMLLLVVVNFGNVIAEFSGIVGSTELFHHNARYITVPLCALAVWALVVRGDYKKVEKIFLVASAFYICYIVAGVIAQPAWHDALVETVKLPARGIWRDNNYIYMVVGVIGTTISPWMQFYCGLHLLRRGGVVHHCGLRGDAVCARHAQHHGRRRRGAGDEAAGRRFCLPAVRGGTVQRIVLRCERAAHLHRV